MGSSRLTPVRTLPSRGLWWAAEHASRLGERHDMGWLVYHPLQTLSYHRTARADAPPMARALCEVLPDARRWVDVGAGGGALAAALAGRGVNVALCEQALAGRLLARRAGLPCARLDLTRDPPATVAGPFDVACCLEVAEHVDERLGIVLVAYLAALAQTIVFTAAHPGQGGRGHVNEQPQTYWIERFERHGVEHRPDLSQRLSQAFGRHGVQASWYVENVMAFAAAHDVRP